MTHNDEKLHLWTEKRAHILNWKETATARDALGLYLRIPMTKESCIQLKIAKPASNDEISRRLFLSCTTNSSWTGAIKPKPSKLRLLSLARTKRTSSSSSRCHIHLFLSTSVVKEMLYGLNSVSPFWWLFLTPLFWNLAPFLDGG